MAVPTWANNHVHTGSNAGNEVGNTFKLDLPNPAGANNCLILCMNNNFLSGRTYAITDNKGNTWPTTPTVTTNDGGCSTSIFVLLGCAAGTQNIQVVFDTAILNVQMILSEWYNVATASATDGSSSANNLTGPNISSGSFTPGTSGDLIINYGVDSNGGFPGNANLATTGVPGSGFTTLSYNRINSYVISWFQYLVQTSAAPINPTFTVNQATHDTQFSSVSLALKSASAGTPPSTGIRINRILHVFMIGSSPQTIDFPCTGNLIAITTGLSRNQGTISSVTDSNSNPYTVHNIGTTSAQIASTDSGATSGQSLTMSVTLTGFTATWLVYDISGAHPTAPFDTFTAASGTLTGTGSTPGNTPAITPSTSNGLILANCGMGTGPATAMPTPTGAGIAVFDSFTYAGETDTGGNDSADGYGHYYNPNTSAVSFSWNVAGTNGYNAGAAAYKAAPIIPLTSIVFFGGYDQGFSVQMGGGTGSIFSEF
jgi:hypothetical protein